MKARIINEELVELLLDYVKSAIYAETSAQSIMDAAALLNAVEDCEEVEL